MSTVSDEKVSDSVNSRLREERRRVGGGQQSWADVLSVHKVTYLRWEKDVPIPSDKLEILSRHGFDVLYVLTGERAVKPAAVAGGAASSDTSVVDGDFLRLWQRLPVTVKSHMLALM
jgi:DNA-binding XRE family transcriptional regulator